MRDLCPVFNTNRMVREYAEKYYLPAYERYRRLTGDGTGAIKDYQQWIEKTRSQWGSIKILELTSDSQGPISVGMPITINVRVSLGSLRPDDVLVQAYLGRLDSEHQITAATPIPMSAKGQVTEGVWEFETTTTCRQSGRFGYSARVLPFHPELVTPFELGLICWADGAQTQRDTAAARPQAYQHKP
jgi:starch phosphorylase